MRHATGVGWAGVVVGALLGAGCLVEFDKVADPTAAFRDAKAGAEKLAGRPGPAHTVNVLVYDPGDHELIRVRVPFWLARKIGAGEMDLGDSDEKGVAVRMKRHLRLQDLEAAGLGVLVEVEEGNGERVLIWLS